MSRYIDADALMTKLQKDADAFDDEADDARKNSQNYTDGDLYTVMGRADGIRDAMIEVYDAPSIDIVRCKECKYAHMTYGGECKYCDKWSLEDSLYLDGDFFCSYGERNSSEKPNNSKERSRR